MNDMSKIRPAEAVLPHVAPAKPSRGRLFALLGLGVAACGAGYYAYDHFVLSRHVVTDNAYVGADVAPVTPHIAAPVAEVLVADTQAVKAGDVLVRLDDTDAKLALQAAEAAYDGALRRVRGYHIADRALALLDVDPLGLDLMDRKLLSAVIEKFAGGPVGLDNLAAAIGESADTIEDVLEPYLIQQGYLQRTPRGRIATPAVYAHLGLKAPPRPETALGTLFDESD